METTAKLERTKGGPVAWSDELGIQPVFIGFDPGNSAGDFTIYAESLEGRIIHSGLLIEGECQRVA